MSLRGYDVRFQTGTDEHGLKIQKAADAKKEIEKEALKKKKEIENEYKMKN